MSNPPIAQLNPWIRIWLHPRVTIRALVASTPLYQVLLLAAGSGVVQSMVQGYSNHIGARFSGPTILLATICIGGIWGLLQLHLFASLLYLVGRWTGAPSPFTTLRTALAWAAIPQIVLLAFWMPATLIFGRFLYMPPGMVAPRMPLALIAQGLLSLATLFCACWWLVLQVLTVAEVQGVSGWRALGHFVVAGLMVGVTALLVVVVVIAFTHA